MPLKASIQNIRDNPAEYFWTLNQPGMQGAPVVDLNIIGAANKIFVRCHGKLYTGFYVIGAACG